MRGIKEMSCMELKKLHSSCMEQERTKVRDRLDARIEVVIDLNTEPSFWKKSKVFALAN
jgi:hypothetical protein